MLKKKYLGRKSKLNSLEFLKKHIRTAKIDDFISFRIDEWKIDKDKVLNLIIKNLHSDFIIIRSAAISELSNQSQAGVFHSEPNIPINNPDKISKAIQTVIESYCRNGRSQKIYDRVIVQEYVLTPILSGTLINRNFPDYPSYMLVDYSLAGFPTNTVTSGANCLTVRLLRKSKYTKEIWRKLSKVVFEIEHYFHDSFFLLEFAVDDLINIHLFQIRFLKNKPNHHNLTRLDKSTSKKVNCAIKNYKDSTHFFNRKHDEPTFLSDMSDWNPAEMIGDRPSNLTFSIYRYLVTADNFAKSRNSIGYSPVKNELMIKILNKPYIDIGTSILSLTPHKIPTKLKRKLYSFYLNKFEKNPALHDKIEFEIVYSHYNFKIAEQKSELLNEGFSAKEINLLNNALKKFTVKLIREYRYELDQDIKSIDKLKRINQDILNKIDKFTKNDLLKKINILFNNCKKLGVYSFSRQARYAFVSISILKSLLFINAISYLDFMYFFKSLRTVTHDFLDDYKLYLQKSISFEDFLIKYQHIYPYIYEVGTYDKNKFKKIYSNQTKKRIKNDDSLDRKNNGFDFTKILKTNDFDISSKQFREFLNLSIISREKFKFEFAKSILTINMMLKRLTLIYNIPFAKFQHYDVEELLKINLVAPNSKDFRARITNYINKNKDLADSGGIALPSVITRLEDFKIVNYFATHPNFITRKIVEGKSLILNNLLKKQLLENRIILLDRTDPGADWIFTQNPLAIITKYGGAGSHLAIRCMEFNIPAVIGCGEMLFNKLLKSKKISLNCSTQEIKFY